MIIHNRAVDASEYLQKYDAEYDKVSSKKFRTAGKRDDEFSGKDISAALRQGRYFKTSGYSPYHFLRVFYRTCGLTPAEYIRKRRISEIAKEIMRGNEFISELAFRHGFNSKDNF